MVDDDAAPTTFERMAAHIIEPVPPVDARDDDVVSIILGNWRRARAL